MVKLRKSFKIFEKLIATFGEVQQSLWIASCLVSIMRRRWNAPVACCCVLLETVTSLPSFSSKGLLDMSNYGRIIQHRTTRDNHFNTQFIAIQTRVMRTCGLEPGQGSRLDNVRFKEANWVKHGAHTSAFLESWLLGPFQTLCRPVGTKTRWSGHQFSFGAAIWWAPIICVENIAEGKNGPLKTRAHTNKLINK